MPSRARVFATSANIRPMKVQAYPVLAGKLATQRRLSKGAYQGSAHRSSVPVHGPPADNRRAGVSCLAARPT